MIPMTTDKTAFRIFASLALLLALCGGALVLEVAHAAVKQTASIGGSFRLTGPDGQIVTDRDFHGKYLLIYFGYTFCPDVCPTTMADLGAALKTLGPRADDIQPLFITIDPKRDTTDVLKQYLIQFSPRLIGLTGSPQQISQVEKEFHVYTDIHRTGDGPDDYTMDHSSIFYLMDPKGRFIAAIDASQDGSALAKEISGHLP